LEREPISKAKAKAKPKPPLTEAQKRKQAQMLAVVTGGALAAKAASKSKVVQGAAKGAKAGAKTAQRQTAYTKAAQAELKMNKYYSPSTTEPWNNKPPTKSEKRSASKASTKWTANWDKLTPSQQAKFLKERSKGTFKSQVKTAAKTGVKNKMKAQGAKIGSSPTSGYGRVGKK
jgi:hypothetical protein